MKIVNVYGSVLQIHGATKYLMAFATELDRQGHDSSIVCSEFAIPKPYWLSAEISGAYEADRRRSERSRLSKALAKFTQLPAIARILPSDADVVVLHSEHALPVLPFARRRCKSAVIAYYCYQPPREVYDLWDVVKRDFGPLTRAGLAAALPAYKLVDRWLARSADFVMVFSPEYRAYARKIYGDLDYVLAPAGIDFRPFETASEDALERRRRFRGGHDHHLLMAAALTRKKNVDTFIRLLACLRDRGLDVRGTVIGEGPLVDELSALAQELGVVERLVLTGYVSQEDLPQYYHSADLLFYLEPNGAWTMSIIEAGAARLPVIVAPGGSMPTLVSDGESGVILDDERDVDEVNRITAGLLGDDARRAAMGENNRRHSREFALEISVRTFIAAARKHVRKAR